MNKNLLRKILPHVVALLVFAAVSALFFAPQYSDKALSQQDMVQFEGMKHDIEQHKALYGEHPQWTGNLFSGMPAYMIDMNYDGRWVKSVADKMYFIGQPAAFIFVAMSSFYLMLLMFGVNPWLGIIGGVAYGLSSYFPIIIQAGHITKMMAMAWIPALIGAIYLAYNKKRWLGAALAGIFASIVISASHPQITYYFLFVIVALVINELVKAIKVHQLRSFWITSSVLLAAAVLAIGSNIVQLYYVADHAPLTIRGASELAREQLHTDGLDKDYATAWSYGKAETFNLFIPNFVGGSSTQMFERNGELAQTLTRGGYGEYFPQFRQYWGTQPFTSGPVYLGALMVFLFVFGLFALPSKVKWWVAAVSALAILLSWGHNMMWLTNWMLDYFPLYNKFRVPSMILVIVQWSVPLLGILALDSLRRGELSKEKFMSSLKYSTAIVAGFAIVAAVVLPTILGFSSEQEAALPPEVVGALQGERAALLRADAMRSLLFVVLGATVIFTYYKGWLKAMPAAVVLLVLTLGDLYTVDRRYLKAEDFHPKHRAMAIAMTPADKLIKEDTTNYRVANFSVSTFEDATTSYFHRSVGGYHPAKLRRYQDVIEKHLSKQNMAVYDMLNTKYFITSDSVVVNPHAAGNAWFVGSVKMVKNASEELEALSRAKNFNPRVQAIVDERFASALQGVTPALDSTATIALTSYKVNELTYHYTAASAGVALFSEIYFDKGWTAKVDGVEAPYFRADYLLRAMVLPAGIHVVEWSFAAPHFASLLWITRLSSLVLLLGALISIVLQFIPPRNAS